MDGDVFTVHVTRPEDVGAVEVIFVTEQQARAYAENRSHDHLILAVSVTRFVLGQFGARYPVAWYIQGKEQPVRKLRPGKLYPHDGHSPGPSAIARMTA